MQNSTVNSPDSEVVGEPIENRFTQEPIGHLPSNGQTPISQRSCVAGGGSLKRRSNYMSVPTMENSPVHIIVDSHPSDTDNTSIIANNSRQETPPTLYR